MIVPIELESQEKIVYVLKHVHKALDYELSPNRQYTWAYGIENLYHQRDHLLKQLRTFRKGRVAPSRPWPRR